MMHDSGKKWYIVLLLTINKPTFAKQQLTAGKKRGFVLFYSIYNYCWGPVYVLKKKKKPS